MVDVTSTYDDSVAEKPTWMHAVEAWRLHKPSIEFHAEREEMGATYTTALFFRFIECILALTAKLHTQNAFSVVPMAQSHYNIPARSARPNKASLIEANGAN